MGPFDILVVGDEEPALCAAACAAKSGARIGVLKKNDARRKNFVASISAVPNFVWRRLDLQNYDLSLVPVGARVTLLNGSKTVSTHANSRDTMDALIAADIKDHLLWPDFQNEVASLNGGNYLSSAQYSGQISSRKSLAALLSDPYALDRTARMFGPCADVLDDYFSDDALKTHLAAHALSSSGFGPKERGSAAALVNFLDEASWRVRPDKNAPSIRSILEKICQQEGVTFLSGRVTEITPASGKYLALSVGTDERFKAKYIFFATPDTARQFGAHEHLTAPTIDAAGHATFSVKFKLAEMVDLPVGDNADIFQIIDDPSELQAARDKAVAGRFPEKLPVEFEFTRHGEIVARSSYLPGAFFDDGEWRGWTGQDRQAAAALIKERLTSRIPGLSSQIRRTETDVITPFLGQSPFSGSDRIIIQSCQHNTISAAVNLIDEVIARDE